MTPEEEARAREIFSQQGREWSKEDSHFLQGLFDRKLRGQLKRILDEVRQNNTLETTNNAV